MGNNAALQILLIEDNPGDARLIREMFRDAFETPNPLLQDGTNGRLQTPECTHKDRLSTGLETLSDDEFDVILLDLNLPDSRGIDTLGTTREEAPSIPIIVLTGLADREIGIQALQQGAEEFLVKGEINASLLGRSVYHAIERARYERVVAQQRERLTLLNRLSQVGRAITHAIIESSTRDEIETVACERLTDTDAYQFAWIGEEDWRKKTVVPRTGANLNGYLDELSVEVNQGVDQSGDPAGRAVGTGTVQIVRDIPNDPPAGSWEAHARTYGVAAAASIPIEHEGVVYGVLNVYAERADAFDNEERRIVGWLGEVIGHAISAIQRKEALLSDEVVELEFVVNDVFEKVGMPGTPGRITFDRVIPVGDGTFLQYGTATEEALDSLAGMAEDRVRVKGLRLLDEHDPVRFELTMAEPPIRAAVASRGGRVEESVIEDGVHRLVVHVPPTTDTQGVTEVIKQEYPDAQLAAKRNTSRADPTPDRLNGVVTGELTGRQLSILEAAYFAGYFNWPRDTTGAELAEAFGIAPATAGQHLRTGERKILRVLFEDGAPSGM